MSATAEQYDDAFVQDGPWLELTAPRHKPVHAAIAKWVFHRAFARVPIRVELPEGSVVGAGAGSSHAPVMRIVDERAFFDRLGADGLIGFGESFMAGEWDADDPAAVLEPLAARLATLVPAWMQRLRRFYVQRVPAHHENTVTGARRNIERHYDLSNDLFALFLDESMTYSSALFAEDDTLERAQMRKVDRLLDAVHVGPDTSVLEIGTGWGALAIRAAKRGARVTSLTLSRAQQTLARQRVDDAGVGDRVDIQLRDYRAAHGTYDAVVSVEMIEAVGERYWPTYFATLDRLVAPDGKVGLQAIVLEHERMEATRDQYTWIAKYIFPGGALPSVRAITDNVREHTKLRVTERFAFGSSYAQTLRSWRERFDAHADEVGALGFDTRFRRMWDFYLAYCEAGFATGYLDVEQVVLAHRLSDEGHAVAAVAEQLVALLERVLGAPVPVRIRAWDGSEAGSVPEREAGSVPEREAGSVPEREAGSVPERQSGPVAVIASPRALRRLVWQPGELGFARAYVTGDLDVDGDLDDGFRRVWQFARERNTAVRISPADRIRAAALALRLGAIGLPPAPPKSEARVQGRLHTRRRDRAVIAHHYDLSNEFYELILDRHMAYSCAYFTGAATCLDDAQTAKLERITAKLAVQPGARLLDVGCGWGSLSLYAAQHRGARVTGVTLSQQQLEFVQKRVADRGLHEQVDVRLQDYRDISDGPYDVAASIEMGEHVGAANYPRFVAGLHRQLRPGGRVLVQQMSRGSGSPGGGPFIEAYIAPDMHMRPVQETVALLEQGGFDVLDVEDLREHYAATAWAWHDNFTRNHDEIVDLVGEEVARVWWLYIVGGALAFEEGRMGVEQILATASGSVPER